MMIFVVIFITKFNFTKQHT